MTNQPNWLDTSIYPFRSNFLPLSMGNMHYVDEGTGDPVLFVHGTPSWSFLYRKLIKELSNNYRCIAPDHIGFGLSDKPDSWSYKLQEHTENLKSLIDHLELQNITLVVHDFGGMIALPLACDEPQRFKRIIVFNTWAGSNEDNLGFERTKKLLESSITQFLYKYLNASARWVMKDAAYNKSFLKGMYISIISNLFRSHPNVSDLFRSSIPTFMIMSTLTNVQHALKLSHICLH